jgi:integrase
MSFLIIYYCECVWGFYSVQSISFEGWYSFISKIIDIKERLLIEIMYYSGCSESELISIKCLDVDVSNSTLRFNKKISRIPKNLSVKIKDYISSSNKNKDSYLFESRQSPTISPKRLQQIVSEISLKLLGEKLTPQDIRSIHIYHALLKNISIVSISHHTGLSYQRIAQVAECYKKNLEQNTFGYEL